MDGKKFRTEVQGLKSITLGDFHADVVGNMQKFRAIVKNLKVLARSSPEDKYLLVTGLK